MEGKQGTQPSLVNPAVTAAACLPAQGELLRPCCTQGTTRLCWQEAAWDQTQHRAPKAAAHLRQAQVL